MVVSLRSFSQVSAMAGIYSGYGMTHYNMKGYNPSGFMPLGMRAAIGDFDIQVGADIFTQIKNPTFALNDSSGKEIYTETIKNNYVGAMLRIHMGDEAYEVAAVLRGGIGYYFSQEIVNYTDYYLQLNPNARSGTYKFNRSPGFYGAFGFSIPVYKNFHANIEGQFNYNPRNINGHLYFYTSWCVEAGVSYNLFHLFKRKNKNG